MLIAAGNFALAQEVDPPNPNKGAFEFSYANDVTSMNDQYYTNGVRFSLTLPVFSKSPFNPYWLKRSKYSYAYHTLNLQYDVFTPDLKAELYTDRPFAATAMLGSKHQYVYSEKDLRFTSELKIGLIGQAVGADVLQNGIHNVLPGAGPVDGWQTQIQNDLAVNYIFGVEKRVQPVEYLEFVAGSTVYLGIPYTKLEPSIQLRIGLFENYFNFLNNNAKRNWQVYLVAGARGSIVAYNATLQGGLFNQFNPYVLDQINHFVANYDIGLGLAFKNNKLIFSQTFTTPEFQGADSHSWGELRLIFGF